MFGYLTPFCAGYRNDPLGAERNSDMKTLKLVLFLMLYLGFSSSFAHAADKVVISYSSRSYAFLPAQVGGGAGFLQG